MPSYLLVSGCERSGTTIFADTIGTHPEIRMGNEEGPLYFIAWLQDIIKSGEEGKEKKWFNPILNWKMEKEERNRFISILRNSWPDIYEQFCGGSYKYIGDKWVDFTRCQFGPFNKLLSPKWALIWREREATLSSMRKAYWNEGTSEEDLIKRYEKCTNLVLSKKDNPNCFITKYEEFCEDPTAVMKKLSEFLSIEPDFNTSKVRGARVS